VFAEVPVNEINMFLCVFKVFKLSRRQKPLSNRQQEISVAPTFEILYESRKVKRTDGGRGHASFAHRRTHACGGQLPAQQAAAPQLYSTLTSAIGSKLSFLNTCSFKTTT
jgi:hypothetical protein